MKLLLLADLHLREDWMAWASAQPVDALLIAGDVLDSFRSGWPDEQRDTFEQWVRSCPIPMAICSGNHDGSDINNSLDWLSALSSPTMVGNGESRVLETAGGSLVVSTFPFGEFAGKASLWECGAQLRDEHQLPWAVLHHDPPGQTKVGGPYGDSYLWYPIKSYQPTFVLSGHHHHQPYVGSFVDHEGETLLFNPGCVEASPTPNAVLFDCCNQHEKPPTFTWLHSPIE